MTLAKTLRRKLSEAPAASERHDFMLTDETSGWSLHLTADRRDAWSTVAWELNLRRPPAQGDVAAWAQNVVAQTGGLLEALRVVEVDKLHDRALLRSATPSEQDDKLAYYELILQGTQSVAMCRFQGSNASGKREQIPFVLTNEVLVNLVSSLTNIS